MISETDHLSEFEQRIKVKPASAKLISLAVFVYIATALYSILLQKQTNPAKSSDIAIVLIAVGIPLLGLILFIAGKKSGWFILVFYFMLFLSFICSYYIKALFIHHRGFFRPSWNAYVFDTSAVIAFTVAFSKDIRHYYDINKKNLITSLIINFLILIFAFWASDKA